MGGVWNVLTLERLRELSDEQVAQLANERLIPLDIPTHLSLVQPADFLAAQYYVGELERRENRRADEARDDLERTRWYVDFIVEALIVILILVEIALSIWDHNQYTKNANAELAAFSGMQTVLSNLRESSQATAETMKAERETMEAMKVSLERQVALFYDVQTNVFYNESTKKLVIANSGRTNVTVWSRKIGTSDAPLLPLPKPFVIVPTNSLEIPMDEFVKPLTQTLPKDQAAALGFIFLLKNEKSEKFTLEGDIYAVWKNDQIYFNIQTHGIVPGWKNE